MKPVIKYWHSILLRTKNQKPRKITTTGECIEQKIRMAEMQLKVNFEQESRLIRHEFQKPDYIHTTPCDEYIHEILKHHIDTLFTKCIKDYTYLCLLRYFSVLQVTQETENEVDKSFVRSPLDDELWKKLKVIWLTSLFSSIKPRKALSMERQQNWKPGKKHLTKFFNISRPVGGNFQIIHIKWK